uniref:Uncharacterized protein n=1 Tax=Oryza glumipatula TaxID=40148 RepID=A0A0D9Z823_9ORYZ
MAPKGSSSDKAVAIDWDLGSTCALRLLAATQGNAPDWQEELWDHDRHRDDNIVENKGNSRGNNSPHQEEAIQWHRKAAATPQVIAGDPLGSSRCSHCYCYHYYLYTDKNREKRINGFKQQSVT